MNYFISVLIGAIISIMILLNGTLSAAIGNYTSTVLIHAVGLLALIPILVLTKSKLKWQKGIPIYLYSAGVFGVLTVLFSNISYIMLGASITLALSLFGQSLFSILIDHFGLFQTEKNRFNCKKLIGIFLIAAGISIMTFY